MFTITNEAREYIKEEHRKGFTSKQILFAMNDGEYLKLINMSQELSEEVVYLINNNQEEGPR